MSIITEALVAALLAACIACGWFYMDSRHLSAQVEEQEATAALLRQNIEGQKAARLAVERQAQQTEAAYAERDQQYRIIADELRRKRTDRAEARRVDPEYAAWSAVPLPLRVLERLRGPVPAAAGSGGGRDPTVRIPAPADSAPGPPGH